MKDAFRDAADKNGLEEIDRDKRYDDGAKTFGISSIGSNGDDAEDIFYSSVGLVLDIPRDADLPEMLPSIFDELGLTFPEKPEETD